MSLKKHIVFFMALLISRGRQTEPQGAPGFNKAHYKQIDVRKRGGVKG